MARRRQRHNPIAPYRGHTIARREGSPFGTEWRISGPLLKGVAFSPKEARRWVDRIHREDLCNARTGHAGMVPDKQHPHLGTCPACKFYGRMAPREILDA